MRGADNYQIKKTYFNVSFTSYKIGHNLTIKYWQLFLRTILCYYFRALIGLSYEERPMNANTYAYYEDKRKTKLISLATSYRETVNFSFPY